MLHRSDELPIISDDEQNENTNRSNRQLDNELEAEAGASCCDPRSGLHRFIALIFMCLLGFGSYFCFDNPAALQDDFIKTLNLSTTQFAWIYAIYSWPNVVLCFIGGYLIDRVFGIRLGTIIYLFILLVGQLLFAFGGILNAYWLMIFGRFIFGIGAESLAVAQNNYAVLWFKGKELNMVFGLQLSFARVGSTVNFVVMEPIYGIVKQHYEGHMAIGVVLLLAGTTCLMSFVCALILGWMDKRAQRILMRNDNVSGEAVQLKDIFTFKSTFWMVSIICVAYYVAIFPFIALSKVFFETKFNFKPQQANTITSLVYIISAALSPFFGFIIDKSGRNIYWVFGAICTTIGAHILLAFTSYTPYIGVVIMGLSYSMLASSLWPLVALIVPEYQLGTAYGICQSVQNLGLATMAIAAGSIVDASHGDYTWLELFFIGWLSVALLSTTAIWIYDRKYDGNLNMSPHQRKEYEDARKSNFNNSVEHLNNDEEPLLRD